MAKNVILQPNSVNVHSVSDYLALLAGCENYNAMSGAKLVILPDTATVGDRIAAINALSPPAPLPPIAG